MLNTTLNRGVKWGATTPRQRLSSKSAFRGHRDRLRLSPRHDATSARRVPKGGSGFRQKAVVAYRESDEIQDWRVKEMVDLCHVYFNDLLTKGDVSVADDILDPTFVHNDPVWRRSKLIVGPSAFKRFVQMLRKGYPDLVVEPVEFSTSDVTNIVVRWEACGTNLGRYHGNPPTRHTSNFAGISTFSFNHERSQLTEVTDYRTPTAEEKSQAALESDPMNVHLAKLHFG
ncbi:hypothetical protein BSKO_10433 [Bryopsis sp. KO-2023]|nr:hypothetical protein BSKO_10433 [Bryopsis sp. KO-2023]